MKVVVRLGNFCVARTTMSQGVELEVEQSDLSRAALALQMAAKELLRTQKGLLLIAGAEKEAEEVFKKP